MKKKSFLLLNILLLILVLTDIFIVVFLNIFVYSYILTPSLAIIKIVLFLPIYLNLRNYNNENYILNNKGVFKLYFIFLIFLSMNFFVLPKNSYNDAKRLINEPIIENKITYTDNSSFFYKGYYKIETKDYIYIIDRNKPVILEKRYKE